MARLARLHLAEEELPELEAELSRIVDYVAELGAVDTRGATTDAGIGPAVAPLRDDVPGPGLPREEALAAAARVEGGAFAVPEFVDES